MKRNRNEKIEIGNLVPHIKVADWLPVLLNSSFLVPCGEPHSQLHKGEVNIFCTNCPKTLCLHCVGLQECRRSKHHLLLIRRYANQDVIRVEDIKSFLDCSDIQPYTVNDTKFVRLKSMEQSKLHKDRDIMKDCLICKGTVEKLYRFCSINCLLSELSKYGQGRNTRNRSAVVIPPLPLDQEEMPTLTDLKPDNSHVGFWNSVNASKKNHKRKGNPARSPFF